MKIGFIGAGKAGCSLGRYLKENGVEVTGYYSRNPESARAAADFTATDFFETIEQIIETSDVLFLTVPDGTIQHMWNEIKRFPIQSKIFCHCSGAMTSAVFSDIDQSKAYGYSIHPLLAIRSKTESYRELSQAFFTIEGHQEHLDRFVQLFRAFGNNIQVIPAGKKAIYHGAAVFISNHAAALVQTGKELLLECGFTEELAEQALMPMFLNNCQGIAKDGVIDALTGPVERNDIDTIVKHLECLEGEDRLLYILLSRKLIKIAGEKHPDRDYSHLSALLKKEMGI